jgi:CubicO group peptidase (beta-lactamase class C family)
LPPFRPDPVTGECAISARLNSPEARAIGLPGSGVTGTASALALLYQAFLHDALGLWDPAVRHDATRMVRLRTRGAWNRPICRTLGFLAAGPAADRLGEGAFFGTRVSAEAFGHEGLGGQMVWADPESGLSFAFLTDTVTFAPTEQVRWGAEISARVAEWFG